MWLFLVLLTMTAATVVCAYTAARCTGGDDLTRGMLWTLVLLLVVGTLNVMGAIA